MYISTTSRCTLILKVGILCSKEVKNLQGVTVIVLVPGTCKIHDCVHVVVHVHVYVLVIVQCMQFIMHECVYMHVQSCTYMYVKGCVSLLDKEAKTPPVTVITRRYE